MTDWAWQPWELALVDEGESPAEIVRKTGRTLGGVYQMRFRRGAQKLNPPRWEPWEDELLRRGAPALEVARATGRGVDAVRTRKYTLRKRGLL